MRYAPKLLLAVLLVLPSLALACSLRSDGTSRPTDGCPQGQHYDGGSSCGCVSGDAPAPNIIDSPEGKKLNFEAPADTVLKEAGMADANRCAEDDGCAASPDFCGRYVAVAGKHVFELRNYFEKKRKITPCDATVKSRDDEMPACVNGRCVLAIPKTSPK